MARSAPTAWDDVRPPKLASLLYAWAFSAPGSLFDHVEMAGVTMSDALGRAQFLVFDVRCHPLPREARERFQLLAARGASMLMSSRTTEVPGLK